MSVWEVENLQTNPTNKITYLTHEEKIKEFRRLITNRGSKADMVSGVIQMLICFFFFVQCHHMSFVDFVVLPPGHGRGVTDFWGWDAHEAQLRCPDGVWVLIEEDVVPGGALNLKSTNLPRPWAQRESSPSRKIPTVEPGIEPGTSWLVVRDSDH